MVSSDSIVEFSPHLPYIYLSQSNWLNFSNQLSSVFPDIHCSSDCRFHKSCDDVFEDMSLKGLTTIDIKLTDEDSKTFNYHIDLQNHLIDGYQFVGYKGTYCYVPVF